MKLSFIIAFAALVLACIILIVHHILTKRNIGKLTESIDKFVQNGTLTPLGTLDNSLSHLQTSVSDLETKLILEKENTKSEAKNNSEFISDISHQLKTPLAGLRLYCEMEQDGLSALHTDKKLELIGKMEKLIYNVLKLEKLRSDTYAMSFAEISLSEMFGELKLEFSSLFPGKNIAVHSDAVLRCDRMWLGEAFGNIIKNACEHTAQDGTIDIYIEQGEKSVGVIIEDNGGGVDEKELPLLFKRFHRTENAAPDSAGIGLSISKAIVEKHHGTISAQNGERGLRIEMCFPLIDGNLKL